MQELREPRITRMSAISTNEDANFENTCMYFKESANSALELTRSLKGIRPITDVETKT